MKKIAVLGAGVMGTGIAQTFAEHGLNVILLDLTEEILKEAKEKIKNNIRFQHLIHKNKEQMNPENVLKFILFTTDYQKLEDVDFVIENVPEKWEVKKEVYEKIDKICKENCIYMVNTSCISITKIAALTNRPSKVVGTHFMNPVPIKAAVETIKGYHTSEETLKELGFTFSGKKFMWYWHPGQFRKKSKKNLSIDEIRNMYGSEKVNRDQQEEQKQIAS
jgi:3-hydroxybutyryl-CoA dehydrogenase